MEYQQHFFYRLDGLSGWLISPLLWLRLTRLPSLRGLALVISTSPSALKASCTWLPVLALTSRNNLTPCVSMKVLICPSETASLGTSDLLASSMISQSGSLYLLTSSIQNCDNSWKLNLSSMAQTSTTALAPRQQAETMDLNASEPAVSQICIFTFLPLISRVLNLKSTPMVERRLSEQILSTNLWRSELLPTPELPAMMILKPQSQFFSIDRSVIISHIICHHAYYYFYYSLCGQFEKSNSPYGQIGARGREPRLFSWAERSPSCACWARSARAVRPQSLRMACWSLGLLRKRAELKARTELPIFPASFRIFQSFGLFCWREQRKLSRSQCFCFWLASSQALQIPCLRASSPSNFQCYWVLIWEQISKASWKLLAWTASANFSQGLSAISTAADAYPLLTRYPTKFFFFLPSLVFTISSTLAHSLSCTASLNSMSRYSGHSISNTFLVALKARNFLSASLRTR